MTQTFEITGMTCTACSSGIERALSKENGVSSVCVNLMSKTMGIVYDESVISEETVMAVVSSLGYGIYRDGERPTEKKVDETAKMKKRFIISLIILLPLMYVSMGHMFGFPLPTFISPAQNPQGFALIGAVLALAIIIINFKYYTRGVAACFKGVPNMDTLVALGSGVAYIYSLVLTVMAFCGAKDVAHSLHFESSAMILTLVTLGKWLEEKSKAKTGKEIEKLLSLSPDEVLVERNGVQTVVSVKSVLVGDVVVVKQGEYVPVDGEIISGNSFIDKSAITGESLPVEVSVGDKITSAALNVGNIIKLRAERVGKDTTLSKIIKMVREAGSSKAPIQEFADRVAGVFVPVVALLSLFTFFIWLLVDGGFNPDHCITYAISVLVISCPCALGLATPVAIMSATGKGASLGVLYKDAQSLQRACEVNAVLMDKTATLTYGKPQVVDVVCDDEERAEILQIASGIERNSNHPLAKCIADYSPQFVQVSDFEYFVGKGATAKFSDNTYKLGNIKLMNGANVNKRISSASKKYAAEGKTTLYFAKNDQIKALFVISDVVKENAASTVQLLKDRGMRVAMLTGDGELTAKAVAKNLNIDEFVAEVMPQDKLHAVQNVQKVGGVVAMVGDGINDSPALKSADVGIAMGNGTDVAIDCADVVIMGDDVATLDTVFDLAKRTVRTIKQNLFWAFFYNVIMIPVAAGAFAFVGFTLNPMIASACMSLSSLFVVGNALRIFNYKNKRVLALNGGQTSEISKTCKEVKEMKKIITVSGMCCEHCAGRVVKAISVLPNVISAEVKLKKGVAIIRSREPVDDELIKSAITDAGYTVENIENK